jgi:hypothetical protein
MYAARGPSVQRYSWGGANPDCEHHPRAFPPNTTVASCCEAPNCTATSYYGIGAHEAGASPWGLLDVLATPAELLRATAASSLPACAREGGACTIQGTLPGAIDFVKPASNNLYQIETPEQPDVYAFRCVLEVNP